MILKIQLLDQKNLFNVTNDYIARKVNLLEFMR